MEKHDLGMSIKDLSEGQPIAGSVDGKELVVLLHMGRVYAMDRFCTHETGDLSQGYIDGEELICPLHSGAFYLEGGMANEDTPWVTSLTSFRVEADPESGNLFVYF